MCAKDGLKAPKFCNQWLGCADFRRGRAPSARSRADARSNRLQADTAIISRRPCAGGKHASTSDVWRSRGRSPRRRVPSTHATHRIKALEPVREPSRAPLGCVLQQGATQSRDRVSHHVHRQELGRSAGRRIVAQGGDGFQHHLASALDGLLNVLLEQGRADRANNGIFILEDVDYLCPSLDLALPVLDPGGRVHLVRCWGGNIM